MSETSYPRPPLEDLDWHNLGFEPVEVNGHIECRFSRETKKWSPPKFIADPHIRLHGLTPALNYGQQIFEGLKAFRAVSGAVKLFRPEQNAARFARSAQAVAIPPIPESLFLDAVHLAVGTNTEFVPPAGIPGAALYIRPLAFATSATVGLKLASEFLFCVYVLPVAPLHGNNQGSGIHGVRALVVEDFDRAAPRGTGDVKVGGNYGPVLGRIDHARGEGYGLTLHLDSASRRFVDEFSTSGFVGVHWGNSGGGQGTAMPTLVVSDSKTIVPSVTIASICAVARSLGWAVQRRPIEFAEVSQFTEVYAAGTAAMLVPVQSVERQSTGETIWFGMDYTSPTSAFAQLYDALSGVQQGLAPDQWGWMHEVRQPPEGLVRK
ncbi:aminotransferase [Aspergillus germanicus]